MNRETIDSVSKEIRKLVERETGQRLGQPALGELRSLLSHVVEGDARERGGSSEQRFSEREVAVLLTDLRGFTAISETTPASTVIDVLNTYLSRMSEIVIGHGGTVDKFMGDSVMALFGAPESKDDDVRRAVLCAVDMQIAMVDLNAQHKALGLPELFMGIGLNTGKVMAGVLGSRLHSEYTVIGDDVNLASRIEAFSLRGQILISDSTYQRCRDFVQVGEPTSVYVKGRSEPVTLRELLGIPSLGKEIPRLEVRRSIRVKVKMPFTYQIVEGKLVRPEVHSGTIVDLSYNGILARVDRELSPHTDIKLGIDLTLVDQVVTDVYAKVLKVKRSKDRFEIGLEFTSVSVQSSLGIQRFVQMLIQGSQSA